MRRCIGPMPAWSICHRALAKEEGRRTKADWSVLYGEKGGRHIVFTVDTARRAPVQGAVKYCVKTETMAVGSLEEKKFPQVAMPAWRAPIVGTSRADGRASFRSTAGLAYPLPQ